MTTDVYITLNGKRYALAFVIEAVENYEGDAMALIIDAREAFLDLAADGAFVDQSEEREEYQLTGRGEAWTRLLTALGFSRKHDESWEDAVQRAVEAG